MWFFLWMLLWIIQKYFSPQLSRCCKSKGYKFKIKVEIFWIADRILRGGRAVTNNTQVVVAGNKDRMSGYGAEQGQCKELPYHPPLSFFIPTSTSSYFICVAPCSLIYFILLYRIDGNCLRKIMVQALR